MRLEQLPDLPPSTIPVTNDAWQQSVADSEVSAVVEMLVRLGNSVDAAVLDGGYAAARRAADEVASLMGYALMCLWCLCALRPAARCDVPGLSSALQEVAALFLDGLAQARSPGRGIPLSEISARVNVILESLNTDGDDPMLTAFGVSTSDVTDSRGAISASHLFASFHGRLDELITKSNAVFSPLAAPGTITRLETVDVFVAALIRAPHPVRTLRSAIEVRNLIRTRWASNAESAAQALADLVSRADRSYASYLAILGTVSQIAKGESPAEQAALELDVYRRMVEGQLRPWGWTVLKLLGQSDAPMPLLAQLRDQLRACGTRLSVEISELLLPEVRNAAAHEDYVWDPRGEALIVGDTRITRDDLARESNVAYSIVCGCELGFVAALSDTSNIGRALDRRMSTHPTVYDQKSAKNFFGANGLRIILWLETDGVLKVVVEALDLQRVNPCIQACLWTLRILRGTTSISVFVQGSPRVAIELDRSALDVIFPLWLAGQRWFTALPVSVFIPALVALRVPTETEEEAIKAGIWFALNDAVHAYEAAHESSDHPRFRLLRLSRSLSLAAESLKVTAGIFWNQKEALLGEPYRVMSRASRYAGSAARGGELGPSIALESTIWELHSAQTVPSVLPTIDTVPLE